MLYVKKTENFISSYINNGLSDLDAKIIKEISQEESAFKFNPNLSKNNVPGGKSNNKAKLYPSIRKNSHL